MGEFFLGDFFLFIFWGGIFLGNFLGDFLKIFCGGNFLGGILEFLFVKTTQKVFVRGSSVGCLVV